MKTVESPIIATIVFSVSVLFGCTSSPKVSSIEDADFEWSVVSAHYDWETSKRVHKIHADATIAWRTRYRLDPLDYLEFSCDIVPTPKGVSEISVELKYPLPRVFVRRDDFISFAIKVDGRIVYHSAALSDDPSNISIGPDSTFRILGAFMAGSEAELRTSFGDELKGQRSSPISLNGFREASVWLLGSCGAEADRGS